MKATEQYCPMVPFVFRYFKMKLEKILSQFILGFSEPKKISHANDDCGDGNDKRYLNFKVI